MSCIPRPIINNRRLHLRIAEIFRVPPTEFKPQVDRKNRFIHPFVGGAFDPAKNRIRISRFSKPSTIKKIIRHERRHGFHELLRPQVSHSNEENERQFEETINPSIGLLTDVNNVLPRWKQRFPLLLAMLAPKSLLATPFFVLPELSRIHAFRKLIRAHGEDALILLYVSPPLTPKGAYSFQFSKWEKRMVAAGYLLPAGGLTEKGIAFLHDRLPPAQFRGRVDKLRN